MALTLKNRQRSIAAGSPVIAQWIRATQPAVALPATTTGQIFRVFGGRIICWLLLGEVTTIIQAQANNLKISSKKLDNAAAAVGTAVDISANVDSNAKEVGSLYRVLSSGAAAVWSNAGAGLATLGSDYVVIPQGEIYLTTAATNTGAMKWDLWYQPLDEGAYVAPAALTASLLTAAI